jgi:hypothetical protein
MENAPTYLKNTPSCLGRNELLGAHISVRTATFQKVLGSICVPKKYKEVSCDLRT